MPTDQHLANFRRWFDTITMAYVMRTGRALYNYPRLDLTLGFMFEAGIESTDPEIVVNMLIEQGYLPA